MDSIVNFLIEVKLGIIMDDLVLNLLFSNDENNFKVTELFFSFLDFKQISVHVTPKLYKKILSKIPNTWEGQELKEYLRGHIINGKGLIGEGEESDREQMLSLAKSLVSVNDKVIIISDKYKKDEDLNSS